MEKIKFERVFMELVNSGLDPVKQLRKEEYRIGKHLLNKLEEGEIYDPILEKYVMKYKANRLLLEIGVDSLNKKTGRFNFRKFIINKGFKVEQLKDFDAYENNNGWIINFVPSPDNVDKEMLVVFWRGDETVFVENVPSTEGEALGFIEGYGIEDI